jgi:pimeloyl-ACP methyl ester carboxylesterase
MVKQPKHLVIIPGVGDDHPLYHVGATLFLLWGYSTHVVPFGWNSNDPATYEPKFQALEAAIAALEGEIYLLGVSAGGTVAVSCLAAHSDKITRAATLSSPLKPYSTPGNPLIELAIDRAKADIDAMPDTLRQRLLSVHAIRDQVVPVNLSQPPGVPSKTIFIVRHVPSIVLGLTLLGFLFVRFFRKR